MYIDFSSLLTKINKYLVIILRRKTLGHFFTWRLFGIFRQILKGFKNNNNITTERSWREREQSPHWMLRAHKLWCGGSKDCVEMTKTPNFLVNGILGKGTSTLATLCIFENVAQSYTSSNQLLFSQLSTSLWYNGH